MAANMLAAYYGKGCDSKNLFDKYKIATCEIHILIKCCLLHIQSSDI